MQVSHGPTEPVSEGRESRPSRALTAFRRAIVGTGLRSATVSSTCGVEKQCDELFLRHRHFDRADSALKGDERRRRLKGGARRTKRQNSGSARQPGQNGRNVRTALRKENFTMPTDVRACLNPGSPGEWRAGHACVMARVSGADLPMPVSVD